MGRTLKRVPFDFDWPQSKVWEGYLNPYYQKCSTCDGQGTTAGRQWLSRIVDLLLLAGSDGAKGSMHPWLYSIPLRPDLPPTADLAELTGALAGRAPRGWGHDSCDRWAATGKIIAAAGLTDEWGICEHCKGEGIDPSTLEAYNAWQPSDPPEGEGYQLWETTSEGSPQSPVFETLDALCEWAAPNASWFGQTRATAAQWRNALADDGVSGLLVMQPSTGEMSVDGLSVND